MRLSFHGLWAPFTDLRGELRYSLPTYPSVVYASISSGQVDDPIIWIVLSDPSFPLIKTIASMGPSGKILLSWPIVHWLCQSPPEAPIPPFSNSLPYLLSVSKTLPPCPLELLVSHYYNSMSPSYFLNVLLFLFWHLILPWGHVFFHSPHAPGLGGGGNRYPSCSLLLLPDPWPRPSLFPINSSTEFPIMFYCPPL